MDALEREVMLKDIFAAFQRPSKPDWVTAIIRQTNWMSMGEFIDACKHVEALEMWPHNVGAALSKFVRERRYNSEIGSHNTIKTEEPFDGCVGPRKGYVRLLLDSKVFFERRLSVTYYEFWENVNSMWGLACSRNSESGLVDAVEYGNNWIKFLTKEAA